MDQTRFLSIVLLLLPLRVRNSPGKGARTHVSLIWCVYSNVVEVIL